MIPDFSSSRNGVSTFGPAGQPRHVGGMLRLPPCDLKPLTLPSIDRADRGPFRACRDPWKRPTHQASRLPDLVRRTRSTAIPLMVLVFRFAGTARSEGRCEAKLFVSNCMEDELVRLAPPPSPSNSYCLDKIDRSGRSGVEQKWRRGGGGCR
ncbi:hypothetical protein LZ30DRAFT_95408 [Colletotrichum cereale]|nr:hypothetical protein LZ30DRAFT_95408 [Colletotrichum cereale]